MCAAGKSGYRCRRHPRPRRSPRAPLIASTLLATLALAAPASAEVAHTVQPGETLWSIAAANNLTTRTVAAYNGLSEDAQVVLGSTIRVPDHRRGLRRAAERRPRRGRPRPRPPPRAAPATAPPPPAPAPLQGGYTVRPGDTLSGLAAGAGVSRGRHGGHERARPERACWSPAP